MDDQVTNIAQKLGMGGRLYRDARQAAEGVAEITPEPKVEKRAPELPRPWMMQPVTDEPVKTQETVRRAPRNWQSIVATMLQILGLGLLSAGCALLSLWLGVVVAGICVTLFGVALGLPEGAGRDS